jgi:hypothetical protein
MTKFPEVPEVQMNEAQFDVMALGEHQRPAPLPRPPQVPVNSKGQPAHQLAVKAVPGPGGFLWWVVGLRYPREQQESKGDGSSAVTGCILLSGKPTRWNVAGPFVSRAVAESCIAPSSRR